MMDSFQALHSEYKQTLSEAFRLSKVDKEKSQQAYARADEMRKQLFAL